MSDERAKRVVESVDHLVIDVSNLAFKHAAKNKLFTSEGLPSSHILGVFREVRSLVRNLGPKTVVFAYDRGAPWRRELVPTYKDNRRPNADVTEIERGAMESALAMPGAIRLPPPPLEYPTPIFDVERLLRCFPGVHMAALGFEADDMMSHWVANHPIDDRDGPIAIISQDHDIYQLVDDEQQVLSFIRKKIPNRPKPLSIWVDEAEVEYQHGVVPIHMARWKALKGDVSDRVLGLKGGKRPGKVAALKTWLCTDECNDYFSDNWSGTLTKADSWLADPLKDERERILKNLQVVDLKDALKRIQINPISVSKKGDIGNALSVLVEFEIESVLEQVSGLFDLLSPSVDG
jgi:5'-3' exonuclease